jgi:aldehyde dehydrogenase (NAD+)
VHESLHHEFVSRLAGRLESAAIGDPFDPAVLYGPMLDARFGARFEEMLDALIEPHHRVLGSSSVGRISSGNPRAGFVGDPDAGVFYHPTLVDGVKIDDALARTETFGPMVGVAEFSHLDEAIEISNCSGYGLSSAIYTNSPKSAFRFRERISAGMVSVNNSPSGAEAHLPFGGNGRSGNGSRQSGIWVLDQVTRWQSVNWDYSGHLQKAQMDTESRQADRDFLLPD